VAKHQKEQRRATGRSGITHRLVVRIELKDGMGNSRWATADLLNLSNRGVGVSLMRPLEVGTIILVRGKFNEQQTEGQQQSEVRWCVEAGPGTFHAGLEFVEESSRSEARVRHEAPLDPAEFDCYEVMQLSSNADSETISRVYRILAQRYHPDNKQTGSAEVFFQLCEAYRTLSDPEQRAGYDARYHAAKRLRWKIFDGAMPATGLEAEKRKRSGILGLLYTKTANNPEGAAMSVRDFEELLDCPREHLQAALWYLKGKGYIRRADNGRYTMTIEGFDEAEQKCIGAVNPQRQLPEATTRP
jgi:hypothetical protein